MRRLSPDPAEAVDLDAAYAWPPGGGQTVRANMVMSADGAGALHGLTEGLSGTADKRIFSVLRGLADVVLAGAGTVREEDYGPVSPSAERQARRREQGLSPVPPIAVLSGRLDLDPAARLFDPRGPRPLVLTAEAAPAERREALRAVADVVDVGADQVDLGAALAALASRGFHRVLCEGGPTLLAGIVGAERLDELCLSIAPVLAGPGGPRILDGRVTPTRPTALSPGATAFPARLSARHVLEEDGFLFIRYAVESSSR